MKLILIIFTFVWVNNLMANTNLNDLNICINNKYKNLNQRSGIVTAVMNSTESIVSEFGDANKDQLFEIGSVTKTMTSSLIAKLIVDKKIKLDSEIPDKYQKDGQPRITYGQLVSHSSGIMGGIFSDFKIKNPLTPFEGLSRKLFLELYDKMPLSSEPNTKFEYSNIAYGLLGVLIEEHFGVSFDEAVKQHILAPLGMYNSHFKVPDILNSKFPEGYLVDSSEKKISVPHWNLYDTAISPAGGLRSTISDMIKYTQANLDKTSELINILTATHQKLFYLDKNAWIGMSWIVEPDKDLIWHNGLTYGYNSIVALSRNKDLAIVALSNTSIIKAEGIDFWLQDVAFDCLAEIENKD